MGDYIWDYYRGYQDTRSLDYSSFDWGVWRGSGWQTASAWPWHAHDCRLRQGFAGKVDEGLRSDAGRWASRAYEQ